MTAEKMAFVCNCARDYYSVSHKVLPPRLSGASAAEQITLIMTDVLCLVSLKAALWPIHVFTVFIATDSNGFKNPFVLFL